MIAAPFNSYCPNGVFAVCIIRHITRFVNSICKNSVKRKQQLKLTRVEHVSVLTGRFSPMQR